MPLIVSLAAWGLFLISRLKSSAQNPNPNPSISVGTVPNVPVDFRNAAGSAFKLTPYYNLENWLAVSKMETAGFNSSLYNQANNPWGMGYATKRPTTAASKYVGSSPSGGVDFSFARYDSLNDASQDIILYMNYFKFPKAKLSLLDHVKEMGKRGYFGSESVESYYSKVVAWLPR